MESSNNPARGYLSIAVIDSNGCPTGVNIVLNNCTLNGLDDAGFEDNDDFPIPTTTYLSCINKRLTKKVKSIDLKYGSPSK